MVSLGGNDSTFFTIDYNAVANTGGLYLRSTTILDYETKPAYTNDTAEGRAKNRRVQLAILPNEQMVDEAEKEAQDGN